MNKIYHIGLENVQLFLPVLKNQFLKTNFKSLSKHRTNFSHLQYFHYLKKTVALFFFSS